MKKTDTFADNNISRPPQGGRLKLYKQTLHRLDSLTLRQIQGGNDDQSKKTYTPQ